MMAGCLIASWLSYLKWRQQLLGVPISWVAGTLLLMVVLARALGAWILLAVGLLVLFGTQRSRSGILIALLLLTPVAYVGVRCLGIFQGEGLVALVENVSTDRAASFNTRMFHEGRLLGKALERPVFGWGGWGRMRIYDERGKDTSLTDGFW